MEIQMPDKEPAAETDGVIDTALGGLTPHQLLVQSSQAEAANVAERDAAKAKNRAKALQLLEAIEKSQGESDKQA
jgi:hypothetical protein